MNAMSLYTNLPASDPLSIEGQNKVAGALQSDPEGLRPWRPIVFSIEKAAEHGNMPNHVVQAWWLLGRFGLVDDHVDRLPFLGVEDDVTRQRSGQALPSIVRKRTRQAMII